MLFSWQSCSALSATVLILACSSSSDVSGDPAGGASNQPGGAGGAASAGAPGHAEAGAGGALVGGAGNSGNGTAGAVHTGGSSATGGQGGASTAGAGGVNAVAGAGGTSAGGKAPAQPSDGCGKASPKSGTSSAPLTVSSHQYYVKLPADYDASKPYPTLFVFNPTGNPLNWAETSAGFESNGAKTAAIRVYPGPASMANGWGAGDVAFFVPLYTEVTNNFCVDKARVFATGESSGGDFSSILGCEHADVLRAAAPCSTKDVSAYPLDATKRKCTGQVTAVVIHGKNDNVVGPANGPKTRDFYKALNHCKDTSQPVPGYTDTLSNCVLFDGCDAGYPVYWCNHTDPNYSGTNHGWPAFAPKMLWDLFSSY